MTRAEKTEADLQVTLEALKTWQSARALSALLGITEQAAHNRMAALRKRGVQFAERTTRTSFSGPKTTQFRVALDGRQESAHSRDLPAEE